MNDHIWKTNLWVCFFGVITTIIAMTLLIPFLPLYIRELGIHHTSDIARWSGLAFAATWFSAALVAPLWGKLGDLYGRKLMLIRASLGMTVGIALMGLAHSVEQLVLLRLLIGVLGGYASGAMIFIAAQTPKVYSGWALGTLSTGVMIGNLIGPMIGGSIPQMIGIRYTFFAVSGLIGMAFLATTFLLREQRAPTQPTDSKHRQKVSIPHSVYVLLLIGAVFTFANLSIEPLITLYLQQINPQLNASLWAGFVVSATALGSILSASRLGKLADTMGYERMLLITLGSASFLIIPQIFVHTGWQLVMLRFLMGLALGGILPCISSAIRHQVSGQHVGTVLGVSVSCQYIGQVLGPVTGGYIGGHFSFTWVLIMTSTLLMLAAILVWLSRKIAHHPKPANISVS